LLIENAAVPSFDGQLTLLRQDVKHVLTHRILLADFYLLDCKERPQLPEDYVWIEEKDIENYGVPRLVELLLQSVVEHRG
jgi:A/G-specific adenine glycosylase